MLPGLDARDREDGWSLSVSSHAIRVLVVDDHVVVRQGLRMFLTPDVGFEVVGEAANGCEAIAHALTLRPDVIVMDLLLPGMSGIQATAAIRAALPDVQVVVLTSVVDDA